MTTSSFADISTHNWDPTSTYQTVQITIQQEVEQGLWANQSHPDGWCCVSTSVPHGVDNSWVTHTYQLISDITERLALIWPSGWFAPAENIKGELPTHFFGRTMSATPTSAAVTVDSGAVTAQPLHETCAAPVTQPGYKPANICV